jgi:hypothetical protein
MVYTRQSTKLWGNGLLHIRGTCGQYHKCGTRWRKWLHPLSQGAEVIVIDREISVLEAIKVRYFSSSANKKSKAKQSSNAFGSKNSIPDKELGYLGEKFIYESELEYALKHGLPASEVEWVSQSVPKSPYDIKTVAS